MISLLSFLACPSEEETAVGFVSCLVSRLIVGFLADFFRIIWFDLLSFLAVEVATTVVMGRNGIGTETKAAAA